VKEEYMDTKCHGILELETNEQGEAIQEVEG
jgi:hypothetical protein